MYSFDKIVNKYFTPIYEAQKVKKQEEVDRLAEKYKEINSRLQVRKVYILEIDTETLDIEIVHNHIEECPICKSQYAATDAYCDLDESGYKKNVIQCTECNSYFKLVKGNWYGWGDDNDTPEVILVSEEEAKAAEHLEKEDRYLSHSV